MVNVGPVGPGQGPGPIEPSKANQPGEVEGERSFKDILKESIDRVNGLQQEADKMVEKYFANPGAENLEEMTIAVQKSKLAFEALMQIRNKLVEAFQQIEQMRI